ncbi:aminodeoxychorismate synthase component I [Indiicoccus explosivorum]|uniref:aminodeoxychorismate synthase component I n=1 Tax=Indiicoccus explosivorum TaxID=1917864 RepID=UPI000B4367BF|nr:aminodeoxychorismate synthase component I [Indiicoccus explosivorum]
METPFLHFEFADSSGTIRPKTFTDPVRILSASSLAEVGPLFEALEAGINEGYSAAGFVSYEAAPAFHPAMRTKPPGDVPLVWFGLFRGTASPPTFPDSGPYTVSSWEPDSPEAAYTKAINAIREAIRSGTTYQVNYTARLRARFSGDDFAFYRQLARNQEADYSAYLNIGRWRVLSASPELFFRTDGGLITAKPMKGTSVRGRTASEDQRLREQLLASEKERAENLMITDLLRNDLSRVAKRGSVHVPELFSAETYPTVHQLTSTVRAELRPELSVFDWFKALFPCGSITGAPKISTMDTIAGLEQSPRGIYCGAIGYITPEKNAVFNVPIRTVVLDTKSGEAVYGAGGGITWDSTAAGEHAELLAKARLLTERRPEFHLLESLRLDEGKYPFLDRHVSRLSRTAGYFRVPLDEETVRRQLASISRQHPSGVHKVRLLADRNGSIQAEAAPLGVTAGPVRCRLASGPVDAGSPFLYHKTTNRSMYEQHGEKDGNGVFSVLLWNERGELTEFTTGNLIVETKDGCYTPPVCCGLLPGVYRQVLLDAGEIEERILRPADLENAERIWFINSVRKWLPVQLIP